MMTAMYFSSWRSALVSRIFLSKWQLSKREEMMFDECNDIAKHKAHLTLTYASGESFSDVQKICRIICSTNLFHQCVAHKNWTNPRKVKDCPQNSDEKFKAPKFILNWAININKHFLVGFQRLKTHSRGQFWPLVAAPSLAAILVPTS